MPTNSSHKKIEDNLEVEEEEEDEEASFSYDLASYPSDLTLSVLHEMWENKDILIPDYQRNFVWNIKQSSLLIESFLIGLPVPQVFFYVDATNKSQVIDGQQRILSVVYYFEGFFGSENIQGRKQVFRLQGLSKDNPFFNKRFEDLSETHQRKLKGAVLRAINIRQLNPRGEATSVYHIFERLNKGGTPLKPQEIRNCVFRGELINILNRLNEDPNWRTILGKKTFDRHQKDVELILRIFGLAYFLEDYAKPLKEFLNKVMNQEKSGESQQVHQFASDFPRVAEQIASNLGPKPFHLRGPLNSSALDVVFSVFLNADGKLPTDLSNRFERLKADEEFYDATHFSTSDSVNISRRFRLAREYLLG